MISSHIAARCIGRYQLSTKNCLLTSFSHCISWEWWGQLHGLMRVWLPSLMNPPRFQSAQFSSSVVSDSLRPHGLQHARAPYPSPTPGLYPNSCPSSQWCHPAISSSVVPFSSRPQSLPASGFFQWVSSLHQVAKVLEFQLQHQSFQWTPGTDLL